MSLNKISFKTWTASPDQAVWPHDKYYKYFLFYSIFLFSVLSKVNLRFMKQTTWAESSEKSLILALLQSIDTFYRSQ